MNNIYERKIEFLQISDIVSKEKNLDREIVIEAIEEALEKAAKNRLGANYDIRAKIDRKDGDYSLKRYKKVVETVEDNQIEISLADALKKDDKLSLDDYYIEDLPLLDFGRIGVQNARQVVMQKIQEAEKSKQYELFKDKTNEIINGLVKRIEYGNVVVDLGQTEAVIRRDKLIPKEMVRVGDRIRSYVEKVVRENRGPQIYLSRIHPNFLAKLFASEVPEIYEGTIEIVDCARDAGSRAKISVRTSDPSLDPVGACIGIRGIRVQAVSSELLGEKIDIIRHSEDVSEYIVNALGCTDVKKLVIDQENKKVKIVVSDDQFSKIIGRRGQNIKLASQLTKYDIEAIAESADIEQRNLLDDKIRQVFMEELDTDDVLARLLVAEGYNSLEKLAEEDSKNLEQIEGFNKDLSSEIIERSKKLLDKKLGAMKTKLEELKVDKQLIGFCGLDEQMVLSMAENGVLNLDDLAGLTTDELVDQKQGGPLGKFGISMTDAANLIMEARVSLGWIDDEN